MLFSEIELNKFRVYAGAEYTKPKKANPSLGLEINPK